MNATTKRGEGVAPDTAPTPIQGTPTLTIRADRLDALRASTGNVTDYRLAKTMGISQANLSRTLRGMQKPGIRFIAALCVALGAKLDDLFQITYVK